MIGKIKKYQKIFFTHWQVSFAYRGEMILWATIEALPLVAMVILWYGVYRQGSSVGGLDIHQLISYYILGFAFNRSTNTNVELEYIDQIMTGDIAQFFLKPLSVRRFAGIEEAAWRSLNFCIIVIPFIVFISLVLNQPLTAISVHQLPLVLLLGIIAFTINILISMIILGFSFFIDQGRILVHFKWMVEGIFSGALLPLATYPAGLEKFARLLPFQFRFAVPVEFMLGFTTTKQIIWSLLLAGFWIVVLFISMKIIWHYSIKRFTSVGN